MCVQIQKSKPRLVCGLVGRQNSLRSRNGDREPHRDAAAISAAALRISISGRPPSLAISGRPCFCSLIQDSCKRIICECDGLVLEPLVYPNSSLQVERNTLVLFCAR
ncbi:hypothetical protein BRADI_2g39435v3 [Brachypodium distachyon]|uniref:Uncharacterized protein n=1 Tax=Brachypodium distachyon TaxID=15368 RepID=A0A2K2DCV0_BRADI|nr:hypothetical protein BRADI_2g39435v3 [Brachypodium distachyon]